MCDRLLRYDPTMTDTAKHADLPQVLEASARYYAALEGALGDKQDINSHRDLLTHGSIATVFEHGISILLLAEADHLASASVLLRTQFEALVRALWLHYCAEDAWVEKYFAKIQAEPRKDPNISRCMDDMLKDLAEKADPAIARKLQPLKDGAWNALNSYVHTGIHPVVQQHVGYSADFAIPTVLNSNGLSGMAALLVAMMANDPNAVTQVLAIQYAHPDCLPPIDPAAQSPNPDSHCAR